MFMKIVRRAGEGGEKNEAMVCATGLRVVAPMLRQGRR